MDQAFADDAADFEESLKNTKPPMAGEDEQDSDLDFALSGESGSNARKDGSGIKASKKKKNSVRQNVPDGDESDSEITAAALRLRIKELEAKNKKMAQEKELAEQRAKAATKQAKRLVDNAKSGKGDRGSFFGGSNSNSNGDMSGIPAGSRKGRSKKVP